MESFNYRNIQHIFKPDVNLDVDSWSKNYDLLTEKLLIPNSWISFSLEVLENNPKYEHIIDLLDLSDPKKVWDALTENLEQTKVYSREEYIEKIKGLLKWTTWGPKEWEYIKNFKA